MWYRNSDLVEWAAVFSILGSLALIYLGTLTISGDHSAIAQEFRAVIYAPAAAIAVAAANYARRNITRQLPSEREHTLPGALIIIGLPVLYAIVAFTLILVAPLRPDDASMSGYFTAVTALFSGFYVPVAIQSLSPPGAHGAAEGGNPDIEAGPTATDDVVALVDSFEPSAEVGR